MDLSPLWLSVKIALTATFFSCILGITAAWFVFKINKFKTLIDSILSLPLVLPPTVVGFFLLILFGRNSFIGNILNLFGSSIIFSWTGGVIASIIASFPLVYRTVRGAFEQSDKNLIYAARTLGMNEIKVFFNVLFPISFPSIVAGMVLAFARAIGEFGATIMICGNIPGKTQTMSIAVYTAVQAGNKELAYKWSLIIIFISFIMILFINSLSKNKL